MGEKDGFNGVADFTIIPVTSSAVTLDVSTINSAIELSSDIPRDSKNAVYDFVNENIDLIIDNLNNLLDLDVPELISNVWPIVIDIIMKLI